jgi:pyruvate dehydrogenase E1 component alpha subunit
MLRNIPGGQASTYAKGLGIPSVTIDGNDIAEVYATAAEAVARARSGGGPTVIEAMTYRWYDHYGFAGAKVGVDGAFGLPYRSDSEVRMWMQRDPIPRMKQFLLDRKLFTADELAKIESDAQTAVNASLDFARKSPAVKATDGLQHVYSGAIQSSVVPTQFWNAQVPKAYIQREVKIAGRDVPLNT